MKIPWFHGFCLELQTVCPLDFAFQEMSSLASTFQSMFVCAALGPLVDRGWQLGARDGALTKVRRRLTDS